MHPREASVGSLRRIVSGLQLIVTVDWRLVLIVVRLAGVAVVSAVVGGRRGRVAAFAQAAVRPRVARGLLGPGLLSDGCAHRGHAAHVVDVADALHSTVPLRAAGYRGWPWWQLRRRR